MTLIKGRTLTVSVPVLSVRIVSTKARLSCRTHKPIIRPSVRSPRHLILHAFQHSSDTIVSSWSCPLSWATKPSPVTGEWWNGPDLCAKVLDVDVVAGEGERPHGQHGGDEDGQLLGDGGEAQRQRRQHHILPTRRTKRHPEVQGKEQGTRTPGGGQPLGTEGGWIAATFWFVCRFSGGSYLPRAVLEQAEQRAEEGGAQGRVRQHMGQLTHRRLQGGTGRPLALGTPEDLSGTRRPGSELVKAGRLQLAG